MDANRGRRIVRVGRREDQGRERDLRSLTPAERVALVWPLTQDAWAFRGDAVAQAPMRRDLVRVIKRDR